MITIDTIYEGLVGTLTQNKKILEISKKFATIKSNSERVFYVCDLLENFSAYPKVLVVEKDEKVSVYYRNHGNKCYQEKDHYKAWQYYNLALMNAPLQSECYGIAIANRSAVFQALWKNKACLIDIEKALSLKCPEQTIIKLKKRQEVVSIKAAKFAEKSETPLSELLILKSPTHERYLCSSNKLKVVFTEEMGRHVVANEDIKVGEVLVNEEPYSQLLIKSQYLFACSFCFSREPNLLPCKTCCFALYCSEKCKSEAFKKYHSIECSLMASLNDLSFSKLELLALRTVIQSCFEYDSWETLFKVTEEAQKHLNTEFHGCVKIDDKWVFDSKYYPSIHTLATNVTKRSITDLFQKSVTAAVLFYILKKYTKLSEGKNKEDKEKILNYLAEALLLHNLTTPTNMHGLSTNMQDRDNKYISEYQIGSAAYAFHSLLNHSCAPNVVRVDKLGTTWMSLVALRPIKKGIQLFDNYGQHHALASVFERRADLMNQYKFNCLCEACIDNWATYFHLNSARKIVPQKISRQIDNLLSRKTVRKLEKGNIPSDHYFKDLCELAEQLEPYAPCQELADCQESIKQCLFIFGGVVDYGYGNTISWKALPNV